MAERVGFEPTVPLQARRISSAVHSTTLPPLRITGWRHQGAAVLIAIERWAGKGEYSSFSSFCLDRFWTLLYPAFAIGVENSAPGS